MKNWKKVLDNNPDLSKVIVNMLINMKNWCYDWILYDWEQQFYSTNQGLPWTASPVLVFPRNCTISLNQFSSARISLYILDHKSKTKALCVQSVWIERPCHKRRWSLSLFCFIYPAALPHGTPAKGKNFVFVAIPDNSCILREENYASFP